MSVSVSVSVSVCDVSVSIFVSVYMSVYVSSVCLSMCLSVRLSMCLCLCQMPQSVVSVRDGKVDIKLQEHFDSNDMVMEMMLMAGEAVSQVRICRCV